MAMTLLETAEALVRKGLTSYSNAEMLLEVCKHLRDTGNIEGAVRYGTMVAECAQRESRIDFQFYGLYWKALHFLAPHDFDSFLLFMEKERTPDARFYLPRRKQLRKIGAVQLMQDLEDDKLDLATLSVVPGAGKAQPLYSNVMTPTGPKRMGDISIGDEVISMGSEPARVIGIFDQGMKSVFEVVLEDGRTARFSDQHLCLAYSESTRSNVVCELKELLGRYSDYSFYVLLPFGAGMKPLHIRRIKYVGDEECRCIYVSDPSHLYVTDGMIITHNTTLGEFFLAWIIGRHPDSYNIFAGHSKPIDKMVYNAVLNITTSEEYTYKDIFPNVYLESTNAKDYQINFNEFKPFKSLSCVSVGENLAGKVRANKLLYCDDLVSGIEEAVNKNRLENLWRSYTVDLLQRRIEGCKQLHIATRWSTDDVIGRLERFHEGNPRARFVAVPDIDPETGESNFNYSNGKGFTVAYFHEIEESMDEVSYKCLFKNAPIEREGLLYPGDSIMRYRDLPDREPDAVFGVCDCKEKGKDYMFAPIIAKYGDDYYLIDCVCSNDTDFDRQYRNLADLILRNNVQVIDFERNNGGDRVAHAVKELVKDKSTCVVREHYTTQNKETKIMVNSEWVKRHIKFKEKDCYAPKSDYGVAMQFLTTYTQIGKNEFDDVPDGMAQLVALVDSMLSSHRTRVIESPF